MKVYMIAEDDRKRQFFKKEAAFFHTRLTKESDIMVVTGDDSNVMGFAALYCDSDFADILFYYIFEQYRGMGAGAFLLHEIERVLFDAGVYSIRFILPNFGGLKEFYQAEGYDIFPGRPEYRVRIGALRYSPLYTGLISGKNPKWARSIKDLSEKDGEILARFFEDNGISAEGGLDSEFSVAAITKDAVKGLVLSKRSEDGIRIMYIYPRASGEVYLEDCCRRLNQVLLKIDSISPDLWVSFATDSDRDQRLALLLCCDMTQIEERPGAETAVKILSA